MKILIISNLISYTFNFREEIISALLKNGYSVKVLAEEDDAERVQALSKLGCEIENVKFNGKGKNILQDISTLRKYYSEISNYHPDCVLTYTIKPNLYGGLASRVLKVKYIPMITGLGEVEKEGKLQKLLILLHKLVMPFADTVFFQNTDSIRFFNEKGINLKQYELLPGSGINLEKFQYVPMQQRDYIVFSFIARLTKAKGIEQFLDAAESYADNSNLKFYVAGKCDHMYVDRVRRLHSEGIIEYKGLMSDTRPLYADSDCIVLPTYHPEGISNVLLESSAVGRPAICTNRPGCREVIQDGFNGFYCKAKDSSNLIEVIDRFSNLSWNERNRLSKNAREFVQQKFDRQIVVDSYLEKVKNC